jgi:hypothetical protein
VPLSPSPSFIRGRSVRAGLALAGGALTLLALAGCTAANSAPSSSPTATPTTAPESAAPTSAATPTPTPTPTLAAAGTPVSLTCDKVLTPDEVYAFNANYGAAPDYKPKSGTAAATAQSFKGVACGWLNQTSGDMIEVSVTQPNATLMTELQNKADSASNPVPTYGTPPKVEGYFSNAGGSGQAQAFAGKYWIVADSVEFGEPGDAEDIMAAVVSHLP